MKIVVLSDTHIPRAALEMPSEVYEAISDSDMIIHAGDFVEKDLLEKLQKLRQTAAVYGNMDSPAVRSVLNQKEIIRVGGIRIGLIHGFGAPQDLAERVKGEFDSSINVIIFGHSHASMNISKDGVLLFNPGSPTDKIFAAANSFGILEINDKKIDAKIVRLR